MTLRALRLSACSCIRHPLGRLAGMLMLVALVFAGAPMAILHAHEGGGRDHSHDAVASVATHADQHHPDRDHHGDVPDPTGAPADDVVLHLHDVGTLVSTVPAFAAPALPQLVVVALEAEPPATSPPTAARIPLHRPPIA